MNEIIDQRGFCIGTRVHESIYENPVSRFAEAPQEPKEQEQEEEEAERWDGMA